MMKNVTICILLVITALMAAGCGKIHTCTCWSWIKFDIIDTTLHNSVPFPIYDYNVRYERESAMECSFWNFQDTVGQYLPEYGIQIYYVLDCYEKGEEPRFEYSENGK